MATSGNKTLTQEPTSDAPALLLSESPTVFLIKAHGTPVSTSSISVTSPKGENLYTCAVYGHSKPHVIIVTASNIQVSIAKSDLMSPLMITLAVQYRGLGITCQPCGLENHFTETRANVPSWIGGDHNLPPHLEDRNRHHFPQWRAKIRYRDWT